MQKKLKTVKTLIRLLLLVCEDLSVTIFRKNSNQQANTTVELQWLEHLWDHEIVFETEVVRANEY